MDHKTRQTKALLKLHMHFDDMFDYGFDSFESIPEDDKEISASLYWQTFDTCNEFEPICEALGSESIVILAQKILENPNEDSILINDLVRNLRRQSVDYLRHQLSEIFYDQIHHYKFERDNSPESMRNDWRV